MTDIYLDLRNYLIFKFLAANSEMELVNEHNVTSLLNELPIEELTTKLSSTKYVFLNILGMMENVVIINTSQERITMEYQMQGVKTRLILKFEEENEFDTILVTLHARSAVYPIIIDRNQIPIIALSSRNETREYIWDIFTAFSNVYLTSVFNLLKKGKTLTPCTTSTSSKSSSGAKSPANGRFLG